MSNETRRGKPRLVSLEPRFKTIPPRADIPLVSVTLSPPVRVAALVGALVLTGIAAFVLFLGRGVLGGDETAAVSSSPVPTKTAQPHAATSPKPVAKPRVVPKPRVASGFPVKIDRALRYNRVVVVAVTVPGAPVDALVRQEARAGAKAGRAGFVALSAANERAVSSLVAKTGVLPAPAVIVVKRPGVVTSTFSVVDAGTVTQAVAQARQR